MPRIACALALACGVALTLVSGGARAQYPYGPGVPAPAQQQQPQQPGQPTPYGAPYGPSPMQGPMQPPYGPPYTPRASGGDADEDSGRGLEFFYARAGAGGAFVAMGALGHADNLRLDSKSGVGGAFELALGVRLLVFTVGPRARLLVLSPATLWQLGAEAAFHVPLGRFEPFAGLQGGYSFGSSPARNVTCASASASSCGGAESVGLGGGDVGLAAGADYYLTPQLSLGGAVNAMLLVLSRKGIGASSDPDLASSASMTGLGVTLGAHAAFHL